MLSTTIIHTAVFNKSFWKGEIMTWELELARVQHSEISISTSWAQDTLNPINSVFI